MVVKVPWYPTPLKNVSIFSSAQKPWYLGGNIREFLLNIFVVLLQASSTRGPCFPN